MTVKPGGPLLAWMGALSLAVFLYLALFVPGTLTYSPFTVQDDARQFHLWMPHLTDPRVLAGDWLAGYWASVSPAVYRLPFVAAAWLGIDPVLFGRLLPAALLALSLWAAWRLAWRVSGDRRVAFFGAAFLFAYLLHDDSLFSATPRAFSAPLLLFAFETMLARRVWLTVALLGLLAAIYPTSAMAGFGVFGLSLLRRDEGRLPLVLPWKAIPPLAVGLAAVLLAAVPLQRESAGWGPVVTLEQAMTLPNMNRHEARSSIVDNQGRIAWVCSARMGYLPEAVPCGWGIRGSGVINALLLVPLLLLGWRALRDRSEGANGNLIYAWAFIACTVCYLIAAVFAFKLHFPGRYTQRILGPLEWMAIGQMLAGWLADKAIGWTRGVQAFLLLMFATPLPQFQRPDPGLMRAIDELPLNARIAGVSEELGSVPALTGRAIAAAPEQAIPWHMTYYKRFEDNLKDSLIAVSAPDGRALAALARTGSTYLALDRHTLETGKLPERYGEIVPDEARAAEAELARGPSLVQREAARCTLYRGPDTVLLDGGCLAQAAPR